MPLPNAIPTVTVTFGMAYSFAGSVAKVRGSVTADRDVVHAASGSTIFRNGGEQFGDSTSEMLSFNVIPVDATGFVDASGAPVTYWSYLFNGVVDFVGGSTSSVTKRFQVTSDQTNVDLDLVPDGAALPAVTAPMQTVTSVAGYTGAVTQEQLQQAVGGGGSSPDLSSYAKIANTVAVVKYASGAYPARPSGAPMVRWFGPTEPPNMLAEYDEWTQVAA